MIGNGRGRGVETSCESPGIGAGGRIEGVQAAVGRSRRYEVSNQDHAFMQGVEVVDRLLEGKPEYTYCKTW